MKYRKLIDQIFKVSSPEEFEEISLQLFKLHLTENNTYKKYCSLIGKSLMNVGRLSEIPFLPIELFKTNRIINVNCDSEIVFNSSGTTQANNRSQHFVADLSVYQMSFNTAFEFFIGKANSMRFFSLLPIYEDNKESSLMYMIDHLVANSKDTNKISYQANKTLVQELNESNNTGQKTVLFGVTFALLELAEKFDLNLSNTIIIETGGMKGRGKELTRKELHQKLKAKLNPKAIFSEYGMTELMSQAYADESGKFKSPPWMKVLIRDLYDPLSESKKGSGGINIIDLANIYSCPFISTSDLGKIYSNGTFEVLGRVDFSDIRGCNLLFDEL